ncbi:MAG: hypothetical protein ABI671_14180, partial [Burkholderiales bacterium]
HQSIGILKDIFPYYDSKGHENEYQKATWKQLHDLMCRELGVKELSRVWFSYQAAGFNGQMYNQTGSNTWAQVCETFMTEPFTGQQNPDRFIKERLSLAEIGLRKRALQIAIEGATGGNALAALMARSSAAPPTLPAPANATARVDALNIGFNGHIAEFNERLRRAGAPLAYHNGFIQVTNDQQIEEQIAKPFWALVADKIWENVSIDMAEALDHRDSGGKDPAIYAAKALESAIKIISDAKGWTTGAEKGAANYIDNLVSQKNGRFIDVWEANLLKEYFGKVRNTVGHGPGSEPMPTLNAEQTNWAIESAMSWVRSLVKRM